MSLKFFSSFQADKVVQFIRLLSVYLFRPPLRQHFYHLGILVYGLLTCIWNYRPEVCKETLEENTNHIWWYSGSHFSADFGGYPTAGLHACRPAVG